MQRQNQILLDVWREACQHIEIQDFAQTAAELLAKQSPLSKVIVRRFDREQATMITVAIAPMRSGEAISEDRRNLSEQESPQLQKWCRSGRLLARGKRLTGVLGLILPPDIDGDIVAVPLINDDVAAGALLLVARAGLAFDSSDHELFEKLREPFSVALENDRRIHEIASLREAAEADRGALLRRLGRNEITDTVVGEGTGLRSVMERVRLVANSDVPVLILGETGTGKELVARAIHNRSTRHSGPFIRVNCGAIPTELIDSQLFGHERGSFTGADQTRAGWFERADRGTLLLDEIGELPLAAQVRFLRVLQDGFVERVGGAQPIHVDVRIVAATHRDLPRMVQDGQFREDLMYRLAVFPILLPPLRERRDDIAPLAQHFADRAALRFGLPPVAVTPDDVGLLRTYDWPGNIRELGAVIDRAAILGDGHSLEIAKSLGLNDPTTVQITRREGLPSISGTQRGGIQSAADIASSIATLDEAMKSHIELVLARTRGRIEGRKGAAALLDINPHTLRARMRKLGVDWSRFREE